MVNQVTTAHLPDGRLPETRLVTSTDRETLLERVRELETLCAEVYVAAVELGFPQPLLNRLWTVAAHGCEPNAYAVEMPPRLPSPIPTAPTGQTEPDPVPPPRLAEMPIPDIPLTDRPFASRPGDSSPRPPQTELQPLPLRRTVMVVDDDPMMLAVLVRILQRENYELITADSGPDALNKAVGVAGDVHLLITDYVMPLMKGRQLAEKMRERYPSIRVLYQTGFSDMLFQDRVELEEGAAFLEKPFTARGLREAARFILFGTINPT
jgi:CheY-like chemotaxis protein